MGWGVLSFTEHLVFLGVTVLRGTLVYPPPPPPTWYSSCEKSMWHDMLGVTLWHSSNIDFIIDCCVAVNWRDQLEKFFVGCYRWMPLCTSVYFAHEVLASYTNLTRNRLSLSLICLTNSVLQGHQQAQCRQRIGKYFSQSINHSFLHQLNI